MNPQPPVTRMRMAARTSSAEQAAPAEFPTLRHRLADWKAWLAETDWIPWAILGLAVFLRFFVLGIKPPHFDEGINGWFVDQVMKNGYYKYDPTNYHGPLHFYVLLLSQSLFGRNLWAIRLPVVLVSIGCVWLALKFEPLVGRNVSRIAALAMAISPGFVFYGRYAIHEVWLQLFSMMFILGLLGLWRLGRLNYLWYAGMGLAGMILTKETYAIHVACAVIAMPVLAVSIALSRVPDLKPAKQTWTYIDLAIYGVGSFIAYSCVKYKTPWCIISFGWPFLSVFGAAVLLVRPKHLGLVYRTVGVLLCISLASSVWLNYFRCSSPDEPYAYVQTYNDMFKLTSPLLKLAKRDPAYYHLTGHLIRPSVYPLPWVLGDFDRVGYYEGGNMPANLDGDFLLVQEDKIKDVESKLKGAYYTEMMTLRNFQEPSKIFFSAKVFKEFFPGKAPDFVGNAQPPQAQQPQPTQSPKP